MESPLSLTISELITEHSNSILYTVDFYVLISAALVVSSCTLSFAQSCLPSSTCRNEGAGGCQSLQASNSPDLEEPTLRCSFSQGGLQEELSWC